MRPDHRSIIRVIRRNRVRCLYISPLQERLGKMMTSRQVSAFFEPGAPPPVLSLPTCQTNFSYVDVLQPTNILGQELHRPSLACRRAPPVMWASDSRSSSPY